MKFQSEVRTLLQGSALGRLISGVTNIFLIRTLGLQNFGALSLLLQLAQSTESISKGGMDYALPYYLAEDQQVLREKTKEILLTGGYLAGLFSALSAGGCLVYFMRTSSDSFLFQSNQGFVIGIFFWILAECLSSFLWDVIFAQGRIKVLSLRQGFFAPVKIVFALCGAFSSGLSGASYALFLASILQIVFLVIINAGLFERVVKKKMPKKWPVKKILCRGLPFYATNLAGQVLFFPLLVLLSLDVGLESVSMVKVGQVVSQVFALVGGSLAPVVFLRLRSENRGKRAGQLAAFSVNVTMAISLVGFAVLCMIDRFLLGFGFGDVYLQGILATRILVTCVILDSVVQLLQQPLLAKGDAFRIAIVQNSSAFICGVAGWLLIRSNGEAGFLFVRLLYSCLPFGVLLCMASQSFKSFELDWPCLLGLIIVLLYCFSALLGEFDFQSSSLFFGLSLLLSIGVYSLGRQYRSNTWNE